MSKIILTSDLHRGITTKTHLIQDKFLRKMAKEIEEQGGIHLLILAGDLASHKLDQMEKLFKHIRNRLGTELQICFVRGNHDYWSYGTNWQVKRISVEKKIAITNDYADKYGIIPLNECAIKLNSGVLVGGWDNWYAVPQPTRQTNDYKFISIEDERFLYERDKAGEARVMQTPFDVVVTHMSIYPRGNMHLRPHFDGLMVLQHFEYKPQVYCYGHSHRPDDSDFQGIRCLNSGSDYDAPQFVTFEVHKK